MSDYGPLLAVVIVSAITPIIVGLLPERARFPQVVILLIGGVVIGPQVLGWAEPLDVALLSDLGLGFLFLLAGYELDPHVVRERAGRLAMVSWFTSLVIAGTLAFALSAAGLLSSVAAIAIAVTTTALGVLLPILKDRGLLDTALGRQVFAAGAVGELAPIVAMALFLGSRRPGVALILLVLFAVAVVALAVIPGRLRLTRVSGVLLQSEHGTGQSTLRLTVALLVALLALASALGFDAVFGAFLAGMVLRRWAPGDVGALERKLDVVGWGVFIPVFFVSSGMGLDIASLAARPILPILFLLIMLVVRGGPALLWYRRSLPLKGRIQLAIFTATSLPLLVALTELAVDDGTMATDSAAALVGAGAVSVLVFPLLALSLGRAESEPKAS